MTLWKTCLGIGPEQHVPDSPLDDMEIAEGFSDYLFRFVCPSSQNSSITYDWHVNGATTALPFSGDRQTKIQTETDIRTNRRTSGHTDRRALGQKRGKTDKTETETRSTRQQTRIKRQNGRQGQWCGMVCTSTRAAVMVGGCVVVVLCASFSCWGVLRGGRGPSPPRKNPDNCSCQEDYVYNFINYSPSIRPLHIVVLCVIGQYFGTFCVEEWRVTSMWLCVTRICFSRFSFSMSPRNTSCILVDNNGRSCRFRVLSSRRCPRFQLSISTFCVTRGQTCEAEDVLNAMTDSGTCRRYVLMIFQQTVVLHRERPTWQSDSQVYGSKRVGDVHFIVNLIFFFIDDIRMR